jgi:hypothetical protein
VLAFHATAHVPEAGGLVGAADTPGADVTPSVPEEINSPILIHRMTVEKFISETFLIR